MSSEPFGSYILKLHGGEFSLEPQEWSLDAGMEYVVPFSGDILWRQPDPDLSPADHHADDPAPAAVGRFQGYVIQATRALNDGVDLLDHCDAHSQDIYQYATTFYDEQGMLKDALEEVFESAGDGQDLLIIDEIALTPAHRGQLVGLRTLRRLVQLLGSGCGFATTIVFPLQFQDRRLHEFDQHPERSRKRAETHLGRYLERLGFQHLPDSVMHAVSMAYELPALTAPAAPTAAKRTKGPRRPVVSRPAAGRPGKVIPFVRRGESILEDPAP